MGNLSSPKIPCRGHHSEFSDNAKEPVKLGRSQHHPVYGLLAGNMAQRDETGNGRSGGIVKCASEPSYVVASPRRRLVRVHHLGWEGKPIKATLLGRSDEMANT